MTTSSQERFDVHQAITNQIIAAIDAGTGKLQMPWHRSGANIMRPINVASGNAYRGVNTVALWAAADTFGYEHGLWGTYRQWQDRGAQVRKGEKSSLIVFYREFDNDDADDNGDDDRRRRCMARASRVFNIAQVDGYVVDEPSVDDNRVDPIASAEAFVCATDAKISSLPPARPAVLLYTYAASIEPTGLGLASPAADLKNFGLLDFPRPLCTNFDIHALEQVR